MCTCVMCNVFNVGLGVGHGHHFEQGVRESNHHNVQRHHQLGSLHHVDHHQPSLHHDVGHHPEDRHVHRLSSRHYLDIGGGHFGKRDADEEEPPQQIQQVGIFCLSFQNTFQFLG